MKNKRTIILTLAAVFALAILLGPPAAQAQKELSVLTWNIKYFQDGFQYWVKEFNKIHPDITIKRFDKNFLAGLQTTAVIDQNGGQLVNSWIIHTF